MASSLQPCGVVKDDFHLLGDGKPGDDLSWISSCSAWSQTVRDRDEETICCTDPENVRQEGPEESSTVLAFRFPVFWFVKGKDKLYWDNDQ